MFKAQNQDLNENPENRKNQQKQLETAPGFLNKLKLNIVIKESLINPKRGGYFGDMVISEDFYILGTGSHGLQIFDSKTHKLRRMLTFDASIDEEVNIRTVIIAKNVIYCYLFNGSIYYNTNTQGEENKLRKLKWLVKKANWQAGRALKSGFKGRGVVTGYKGTICIGHLRAEGGVSYTTILERDRTRLGLFGGAWIKDQLVAGEHQNLVVSLMSGCILVHNYSFDNKKLLRSFVYEIPSLDEQRATSESPELMECIACGRGSFYIAVSFIEWRRVPNWRSSSKRKTSRLLILKLTSLGLLEEFASCDLIGEDIGPIRVLKIFQKAYMNGRYLMVVAVIGKPYISQKVTFFCFDQLERSIRVVKSLETLLDGGDIHVGKRMLGGVWCVNSYGRLIGFELKSDSELG